MLVSDEPDLGYWERDQLFQSLRRVECQPSQPGIGPVQSAREEPQTSGWWSGVPAERAIRQLRKRFETDWSFARDTARLDEWERVLRGARWLLSEHRRLLASREDARARGLTEESSLITRTLRILAEEMILMADSVGDIVNAIVRAKIEQDALRDIAAGLAETAALRRP